MFDYEVQREYTFFLAVEDNGRTSKRLSETSPVTIRVGNVDDEPTQFTQSTFSKCRLAYSQRHSLHNSIIINYSSMCHTVRKS